MLSKGNDKKGWIPDRKELRHSLRANKKFDPGAARGNALSGKTGALNGLIPYTGAIYAADNQVQVIDLDQVTITIS